MIDLTYARDTRKRLKDNLLCYQSFDIEDYGIELIPVYVFEDEILLQQELNHILSYAEELEEKYNEVCKVLEEISRNN